MSLPSDSNPGSATHTERIPPPRPSSSGLDGYVGQILGERYRISRLLGQGGMGSVFLGRHVVVGKPVAVKILDSSRFAEEDGISRLFREAQAAAAIGHPAIIDVHDVGLTPQGDPYLVMEYLEGEDLSDLLKRQDPLSLAAACAVSDPILSALDAAHTKGIVHRDLKPSNIYLALRENELPKVKLIDFGISKFVGATDHAKLTVSGAVLGTPTYMSPEQARGEEDVDGRTDLYAVGVMLMLMLTGRRPYEASNYNELIFKIVIEPPDLPDAVLDALPENAGAILRRAIAKDPADRYQSATELLEKLRSLEAWGERAEALEDLASEIVIRSRHSRDLELTTGPEATAPTRSQPGHTARGDGLTAEMETRLDGSTSRHQAELPLRRPVGLWIAGVIAAVLAGAALAAFWLGGTTSGPADASTAQPDSSMASTTAQPDGVAITIRGAPSGAKVFYDGAPVALNPFRVKAGETIVPIRVELPGHEPFVTTVVPSEDVTVEVTLAAAPQGETSAAPSSSAAPKQGEAPIPGGPPDGMGKSGRGTLYTDKFD
ncbi:MAG: serine/threonine protein kinase [Deltaproteobacteria bacterium]|nr:serine/threonine protein kinase [Deltaproteobacteria bacterium]